MKIRKVKKIIKKVYEPKFVKIRLKDLKLISIWAKINHVNSKINMKILTGNFYRKGQFIFAPIPLSTELKNSTKVFSNLDIR